MRTMIAIPCMDMVHAAFMRSLARMKQVGETEVEILSGSLIYDSRNRLAEQAVEGGFDRMLWLDADMVFEPELMQILSEDLDSGLEMVCGLYFKRVEPITPVIYKSCGLYSFQQGKMEPHAMPYWDYPQDAAFEIDACGFGAVMLSVEALKRTRDKLGAYPFMPVMGFGEDLSFCLRFQEAGGKIWCDSRAKLGHAGGHIFTEEDYLTGRNKL